MADPTKSIEETWSHATAEIPARGLEHERRFGTDELAAIAGQLDILAIERLAVSYRITPAANGRFTLTGRIQARVVQACVVTLDPVHTDLTEGMDVEFRPPGEVAEGSEEEQEALAAPEFEPIEHHRIAVGRIVLETLAAALPAYPRTADAALDQHEAGPSEPGTSNPFSALAGWKPRSE